LIAGGSTMESTRSKTVFRANAAFAKPEIYEALEERGVKYAIRIPSNDSLERDITELLTRPAGQARATLLVAAGREPSDAVAVRQYGAKD
jgi:hypothetical protein